MLATALSKKTSSFLNKKQLVKLRMKALRAGVWFRALPRIDRVLVDLTIKVASSVRSTTLAKNILVVTRKLEGLLESSLSRAFRSVALQLARKLSLVAQKWGSLYAKKWDSDLLLRAINIENESGSLFLTFYLLFFISKFSISKFFITTGAQRVMNTPILQVGVAARNLIF